ncbi:MAG: gamma-glutamylcyclotransferase [Alphaproteobacteria bacterium]|nr:gamma-glutamylcyclotransferase [Alphaproteobacteria bacterium]
MSEPGDVWFFAYGSLMWNPGFQPSETCEARLDDWHRRFCVSSIIYRGTPEKPGLSLGLERGGECRGLALRIAEPDREQVFAYLAEREMPEEIYSCVPVSIEIEGQVVLAYTLIVNPDHALYVGEMPIAEMALRIAKGHGKRGPNRDYLASTVEHLESLGIRDEGLAHLLSHVDEVDQ